MYKTLENILKLHGKGYSMQKIYLIKEKMYADEWLSLHMTDNISDIFIDSSNSSKNNSEITYDDYNYFYSSDSTSDLSENTSCASSVKQFDDKLWSSISTHTEYLTHE